MPKAIHTHTLPPHLWHDRLSRWVDGGEPGRGERGGTGRKAGEGTEGVSYHAPIWFSKPPQGKAARAAAPV